MTLPSAAEQIVRLTDEVNRLRMQCENWAVLHTQAQRERDEARETLRFIADASRKLKDEP